MTKANIINASTEWSSPSNLAIVKYWGKRGQQEPLNPSISFSLKNAVTKTKVTARESEETGFTFKYDGVPKPAFNKKIEQFLNLARHYLPFINHHHLTIESTANFPHSSGIASSASSMSALALCLITLHNLSIGKDSVQPDLIMASSLARLGSGSAARSLFGGWCLWGKYPPVTESSDMYAVPIDQSKIHPTFQTLRNTVLVIDPDKKPISSSEGHHLMQSHPFREARIDQAHQNTGKLLETLSSGNWAAFIEIAENEALTLHGLMMGSTPSYTLLKPNTLKAIQVIREARQQHNLTMGFSMDAGPNIHLLYPEAEEKKIRRWIEEHLRNLCHNGHLIHDEPGDGPTEHPAPS